MNYGYSRIHDLHPLPPPCPHCPQGATIRQFFSGPYHFSFTYITRKGRRRYRKPPLWMGVSVYVWHSDVSSCCILRFIGITLGITMGSRFGLSSYEACDPSRDWRMQFFLICDSKCDPKEIRLCNNMTDRMSDSIRERQYGQYCNYSPQLSQKFTIIDNCNINSQL